MRVARRGSKRSAPKPTEAPLTRRRATSRRHYFPQAIDNLRGHFDRGNALRIAHHLNLLEPPHRCWMPTGPWRDT
jgi:hypothetical protein